MFDRFTDRARKAMSLARQTSQRFNHDYIAPEHILLGLLDLRDGVGAAALVALGADFDAMRRSVESEMTKGSNLVTMGQLPFTHSAKRVLECSLEEAQGLGQNYIGTEHLLLGVIRAEDNLAADVLRKAGVDLERTRAKILELLAKDENATASPTAAVRRRAGRSRPTTSEHDGGTMLLFDAVEKIALPALVALLPSVATVVSLFTAGRGFASVVKEQHLRAELDGLHFTIERIKKAVEKDRAARPEDFREFLEHPATVKLLAQARDDWAVAQMRPNLARLAAVVAGRWERREDEIEKDLRFARAAMDLPRAAVELVMLLAEREAKGLAFDEPKEGPIEDEPVRGSTALSDFVASRTWPDVGAVNLVYGAALEAQSRGLMVIMPLFWQRVDVVTCADGQIARYRDDVWAPTSLGLEFARLVRDAGAEDELGEK